MFCLELPLNLVQKAVAQMLVGDKQLVCSQLDGQIDNGVKLPEGLPTRVMVNL